ncbi:MAG: sugar phosphate isomerase/epimerase [Saprospiraceae bacterium]|nr:sugar phosphate isomerase/epimerase [Saprospiraceae bacterium]
MQHRFSRRRFLQISAVAAAAGAMSTPLFCAIDPDKRVKDPGLQLWSVREEMTKDAKTTIGALAKMGYRSVEGFGYKNGKMFGMPITDFSKLLKDNGFTMPSSHTMFALDSYDATKKSLTDDAKRSIDDAAAIGQKYVICPWMNENERSRITELMPVYTAAAEYCKTAGVQFGYHNHDFEFTKKGPDGRLLIEWLLQDIDPKLVTFEMDIYWVSFAKFKPTDWFERFPGRWELCHVKDMAKTAKQETVEVGDGSIDFPAIFKQSKKAGLKHYVIELENYLTSPMQGVERSLNNFKKLKW